MNIRKANERGRADFGWLQSAHSFSFGQYYDPKHMGVSVLRVINDDRVAPSAGFDTHGHKDMEIISYVTKGALRHKDSTGNDYIIPAGDVQRMTAGTGIYHSEYNASDEEDAKFLQIWVLPEASGLKPDYEQKTIEQDGKLTTLVSKNGESGSVSINQQFRMSRIVLSEDDTLDLPTDTQIGYLHIVQGSADAAQAEESATLSQGDALTVESNQLVSLRANETFEALWFELPKLQ